MKGKKEAMVTTTAGRPKTPFDALAERQRKRTLLLRLNDAEMTKLEELSALHNVSRANVMRMLLNHGHTEAVETPFRKKSEAEIEREAVRRAIDDQVETMKKELLEGAASRTRAKDSK